MPDFRPRSSRRPARASRRHRPGAALAPRVGLALALLLAPVAAPGVDLLVPDEDAEAAAPAEGEGAVPPVAPPAGGQEVLVDGIAAQVGNEIVLISEVRQLSLPVEARMRAGGAPDEEIARLRADILESLIERALIRQVVRRSELEATDAEVDAAVSAIAAENGISVEQLRESVESQGLDFQTYRGKIQQELEHTKVMNGMVASQVRIEDEELKAAYEERYSEQPRGGEEVHLRHILVPFTSSDPDEQAAACALAREARQRIGDGEPFEAIAPQISPVNPRQGGDIGWIHVDTLASWMVGPVNALSQGETSDVIQMPFGCNLLQLVERRTYTRKSFEDVEPELRQKLFQEKMRTEYVVFIDKLRENTYVERKGIFADAARLGGEPPPAEDGRPTADAASAAFGGGAP